MCANGRRRHAERQLQATHAVATMRMQAAARRSVYQRSLLAQATGARWLRAALLRTQAQGEWTGKGGAAVVLDRVARAALGQRRLGASISQKSSI
jgi:hypothetical protein